MSLKIKKLEDMLKYFRELTWNWSIQQSSEPKEIDLIEKKERKKKT